MLTHAMITENIAHIPPLPLFGAIAAILISFRLIYNLYFHPLAKYPGPWYAASTSLSIAVISLWKAEPQWLLSVVKKHGSVYPLLTCQS